VHREDVADFKKLEVWRKAHALSLDCGRMAGRIRGQQYASLRSQLRRAASSIPTNIVEGRAMQGSREFARYVGYSIASSCELEYHLISARDFGVITASDSLALLSQLVEVRKMLYGLLRKLRRNEDT
jgi:four helix bundle protein